MLITVLGYIAVLLIVGVGFVAPVLAACILSSRIGRQEEAAEVEVAIAQDYGAVNDTDEFDDIIGSDEPGLACGEPYCYPWCVEYGTCPEAEEFSEEARAS